MAEQQNLICRKKNSYHCKEKAFLILCMSVCVGWNYKPHILESWHSSMPNDSLAGHKSPSKYPYRFKLIFSWKLWILILVLALPPLLLSLLILFFFIQLVQYKPSLTNCLTILWMSWGRMPGSWHSLWWSWCWSVPLGTWHWRWRKVQHCPNTLKHHWVWAMVEGTHVTTHTITFLCIQKGVMN